jgi:hypothetical protein
VSAYNVLRVRCESDRRSLGLLVLQEIGNHMCVWNRGHASEAVVFRLPLINPTTEILHFGFSHSQSLSVGSPVSDDLNGYQLLSRVVVDRIVCLATHAQETADPDCGSLLPNLVPFQIPNQILLELADHRVMIFDKLGQSAHAAPDMNGGSRIWDLHGLEDGSDSLVGLELLRNTSD